MCAGLWLLWTEKEVNWLMVGALAICTKVVKIISGVLSFVGEMVAVKQTGSF